MPFRKVGVHYIIPAQAGIQQENIPGEAAKTSILPRYAGVL
jgi:hypothetical protein